MKINIRQANNSDIDQMADLLYQLFSIEQDFKPNPEKQKRGLELLINETSTNCVLVAEIGKTIVGMITAQVLISTSEGSQAAILEDMIVEKNYRRKGIGKLLMDEIEKWAVSNNIIRLQLLADKNNVLALEFYKSLGWKYTYLICLRKFLFM